MVQAGSRTSKPQIDGANTTVKTPEHGAGTIWGASRPQRHAWADPGNSIV